MDYKDIPTHDCGKLLSVVRLRTNPEGAKFLFNDGSWNNKFPDIGEEVSVTCPHCNEELTGELREFFWDNFRDRSHRNS